MIILTGREVFRLNIDRKQLMTKKSEKADPRPYYRAQYGGIGFTVGQEFMDAFTKGDVAEVTLNDGEREVADPLNPNATKKVKSIAFGSFANKAQITEAVKFEKELKEIEEPALAGLKLDDAQVTKLQKLLLAGNPE